MLSGVLALAASAMRPVHAAPPAPPPAPWVDADIGSPGAAGSATVDSTGVWTIMGSGGDIEGTSDSFNFVYQKVSGDATITAHFLSMVPGDSTWTKIGPMIRVDDTDGAQNVTMDITTAVGVRIQGRDDAFATTQDNIPPVLSLTEPEPVWLRLERIGKNVAAFYSLDGNLWYWGGGTLTLSSLADPALFGLAITAHQDGTLATGKLDNVSIQAGPQLVYGLQTCSASKGVALTWQPLPGADSYNIYRAPAGATDPAQYVKLNSTALASASFTDSSTALVNNQQYTYVVAPVTKGTEGGRAAIQASPYVPLAPPGFTVTDINQDPTNELDFGGGCIPPLGAFYDPTTDTTILRGAGGSGIGGTDDTFDFTNKQVTGNFQVSAKALTRPLRTSSNAKAGLMIREGVTTGAREADLVLTASQNGLIFEWRDTASAAGTQAANPLIDPVALVPPVWIRLTRKGDNITAEYSTDGTTWKGGTDPNNQTTIKGLAAQVNVGLAITSDQGPGSGRDFTQATFQNLTITPQ
jgi:regulation of enolase protein 1 (concanavalin A-like superfamily)